jgi:hypothetical protein
MPYPEPSFPNSMLPDICLNLRMALNGGADPWSDKELDECFQPLQHRLDKWKPSSKSSQMMDECVRLLVIASLAECKDLRERLWTKAVIAPVKHYEGKVFDDHAGYGLCLDPGSGLSIDLVDGQMMLKGLEGKLVRVSVEVKDGQ